MTRNCFPHIRHRRGILRYRPRPGNLWVSLAGMPALKLTASLVDSGFSDVAIL